MSLAYIGPIQVEHGNPSFGFESDGSLIRSVSIAGLATWAQANALSELVANPDRAINVAGRVGVLEPVWFDDPYLAAFCGLYLLEAVGLTPSQEHSLSDYTAPFSLRAHHLGPREAVVTHSSRQLANDFGLAGQSVVASPYWDDDGPMLVYVGGTAVHREYEATP